MSAARILDQRNADRLCIIVDCEREATDRGKCAMHAHYFRVVLADPWYRNHPCPELDEETGAIQAVMFSEET